MQVAIGFVGNYAPNGLSPQMYDMPVIQKINQLRELTQLILYLFILVPCREAEYRNSQNALTLFKMRILRIEYCSAFVLHNTLAQDKLLSL